ncbi:MAG TPA: NAD(P)-binding domain-containing protein, partial [Fimbriimonas sp.]|nr:NAD(P)-binding domain-containing protein [Fimbriimonas sp.]
MYRIGFIGMGVMGAPMAGHLVKAGNKVTLWNRTPSKCAETAKLGAEVADTIQQVAEHCDVIITCVGRSEDVQEVVRDVAEYAPAG